MKNNDLRYTRTDKAIRKSFTECVNKYGFEKTSITMICEKALIGRKTFYLHYLDKYDLLDKLFEEFETHLSEYLGDALEKNIGDNNIFSSTEFYFNAIYNNREDFIFLAKASKEKAVKSIYKVFFENTIEKSVPNTVAFFANIKNQLTIGYMLSSMVDFTERWLQNNDKISINEAIELFYKLCEQPTTLLHESFKE